MSQRVSGYEREEGDFYPTPPWVTEALLPHIPDRVTSVWEPAAGDGAMASVLQDARYRVFASDIEARGKEMFIVSGADWDFLGVTYRHFHFDAIITNPPYGVQGQMACRFISHALALTRESGGFVAMLLGHGFDCAGGRRAIFARHPAWAKKLTLLERIVWFEDPGNKNGPSKLHAWYIWDWRHEGPAELAYGPEAAQAELLGEAGLETV